MFYCDPCGKEKQWPGTKEVTLETCAVCKSWVYCNEVSEGLLEQMPQIMESLQHPETYVRPTRRRPRPHTDTPS